MAIIMAVDTTVLITLTLIRHRTVGRIAITILTAITIPTAVRQELAITGPEQ